MMLVFCASCEDETLRIGRALMNTLTGGGVVHLKGTLGAGKTTLCRGMLRALGYEGAVKSPTFTLVEPYEIDDLAVFHFDLYRLADPGELDYIGIDDYFGPGNLCLIEWPEKAEGCLPGHDLVITIDVAGEKRNIGIEAASDRGLKVCDRIKSAAETADLLVQ